MIQPPFLKPGDRIAIISTARKITLEEIKPAIEVFESWGLTVETGASIGAADNQFAGPDELRRQDLQQMLDRPEIRAVFCARGGYGTARIIDQIDFSGFAQAPKWVVGFSDVTVLLSHLYQLGFESVHAIMPVLFSRAGSEAAIQSLKNVLFGSPVQYQAQPHPFNRPGAATGALTGGNLTMLHTLIATPSDVDTRGTILFLEDLDEYLYHIDRMLGHLNRCGKLQNLAGLVVGHMSDMNDNTIPFGHTAYDIIRQHISAYNYPVCFDFPVGHEPHNLALVCGRQTQLNITDRGVTLIQEPVF
ncbi:MAG: LD-carboxypeptidase [Hymenobacteraceae bacterium]|nr:LD-carboxypeptidase [Hymenobacteraceae bacterium]MDX5396600.1 LD-carboxypeptidase [Hymenobacteraceae bacterium]MDX5443410.1 LD-carboxypeptidase [Hymenobacteraceae bacterium]MDX5512663.1 LD-carboxypeptidase [Hymenobacteraceae bacterium]